MLFDFYHVEDVIHCLHLADLDVGSPETGGRRQEKPVSVLCGLGEDSVEVRESGVDAVHHLSSLSGGLRARIDAGMETFTNLLDSASQCVSLEENDEDSFVETCSCGGRLNLLIDVRELHENIPL